MAKLVIGTNKQTVVPAVVRDKSPAYYLEYTVDSSGYLKHSANLDGVKNVTKLGDMAFAYAFAYASFSNPIIDFSKITEINGEQAFAYAFYNASGVEKVDLSGLKIIKWGTRAFLQPWPTSHTTVDFSSLEIIYSANQCFQFGIVKQNSDGSQTFPRLRKITSSSCFNQAFMSSYNISVVKFLSLNYADSNPFLTCLSQNSYISEIHFPAMGPNSFGSTSVFSNMFAGKSGKTIHLPKNLDPAGGSTVISSLSGYPNFGGTNTVLVFDLPSAVLLTGANNVVYERNPIDDTGTALAWRKNEYTADELVSDWTSYYTSTTNDPTVGATIYSDSACTTSVTTISSIA